MVNVPSSYVKATPNCFAEASRRSGLSRIEVTKG